MAAQQRQTTSKVVKLEIGVKERLERLAKNKDRSPHWLMKDAILRYLNEEEYNEQLKQETLARWQEVENGKTISHQAVVEWLDTWGTDAISERPTCDEN